MTIAKLLFIYIYIFFFLNLLYKKKAWESVT